MREKEQIEELASEIEKRLECAKSVVGSMNKGIGYWIAEDLVDKNYRKVGENEVVISKDGKYRTIEEIEFFVKHNAEVRKQMAKGIITFLGRFEGKANIAAKELAKEYGLEKDK